MRIVIAALIAAVAMLTVGCVQSPTGPGLIFMNVKGPLGPAGGEATSKKGKSCARVALVLYVNDYSAGAVGLVL